MVNFGDKECFNIGCYNITNVYEKFFCDYNNFCYKFCD